MARAFLGLGSNLGDRMGYLRDAVNGLPDVYEVSKVYESPALGGPPGQGPFLNAVVGLRTDLDARTLLKVARGRELIAQRRRTVRWGPRTLDVDVLLVEGVELDEPDLTVPHPRLWERPFVVAPLADLAPDLVDPATAQWARSHVRLVGDVVGAKALPLT